MSLWTTLGLGAAAASVLLAWVGGSLARTLAAFLQARRASSLASPAASDDRSSVGPGFPALDGPLGPVTLDDAETRLLAALDGLRRVQRQLWWEVPGLGDPALRQRDLVAATAELIHGQRTLAALHRARPYLDLSPGDPVALVEDPVQSLALRRAWLPWLALTMLPGFVRGSWRCLVLRRRVAALLEVAQELDDRVSLVRASLDLEPAATPVAARANAA
jgi:hypothetical protein